MCISGQASSYTLGPWPHQEHRSLYQNNFIWPFWAQTFPVVSRGFWMKGRASQCSCTHLFTGPSSCLPPTKQPWLSSQLKAPSSMESVQEEAAPLSCFCRTVKFFLLTSVHPLRAVSALHGWFLPKSSFPLGDWGKWALWRYLFVSRDKCGCHREERVALLTTLAALPALQADPELSVLC